MSLTCPSLQILVKTQTENFRFLDFWSIHYKEKCHDSRTSHDIDMKLGPVTRLNKRNTVTSKEIDYNLISADCDVIVIFPIYDHFSAIGKLDSRRMVYKTYITTNSNLLSYKNRKISNTALILLL